MTKNTADVRTLATVMKEALGPSFELKQIPDTYDGIAEHWHGLIQKLLTKTPRLNAKQLTAAAAEAFDIPSSRGAPWARSLVDCVAHCRQKLKSATSGKKLNPAVFAIIAQLSLKPRKRNERFWTSGMRSTYAKLSPRKKQSAQPQDTGKYDAKAIASMYARTLGAGAPPVLSAVSLLSDSEPPSQGDVGSVQFVSSQSPARSDAESRCYVDSQDLSLVRVKGGKSESAKLVAGPAGFAVAHFKDGSTRTSECPNLVLTLPFKRPAAATADKEDARSDSFASEEQEQKKVKIQNAMRIWKKPAASLSTASCPPPSSKQKYMGKPDNALALRPGGCSKCRHMPGCTPSCWRNRFLPTE